MLNQVMNILKRIRGEYSTEVLVKRGLKIGKNFNKTSHVIIDYGFCWLIEIGDNVTLAPRTIVLAHDATTKMWIGKTKIGRVTIGNNVFVGANSVILPNVKIGNNVVIGAGSVVASNIPDNVIACGVPAVPIMTSTEYIEKMNNKMNDDMIFNTCSMQKCENVSKEEIENIKQKLGDSIGFVD